MTGTVKTIKESKGYGFIRGEDNKEYFFHREDFLGHWEDLENDYNRNITVPVDFIPNPNNSKGARAANVSRTDYPNQVSKEYTS